MAHDRLMFFGNVFNLKQRTTGCKYTGGYKT